MSLLSAASGYSAKLTEREKQAMDSVLSNACIAGQAKPLQDETAQNFAIRILHDAAYHQAVADIMTPLNEFFILLNARTDTVVAQSDRLLDIYGITTLILLIIVIMSIGAFILFIHRQVIQPILKTSKVFAHLRSGNFTERMEVKKC